MLGGTAGTISPVPHRCHDPGPHGFSTNRRTRPAQDTFVCSAPVASTRIPVVPSKPTLGLPQLGSSFRSVPTVSMPHSETFPPTFFAHTRRTNLATSPTLPGAVPP